MTLQNEGIGYKDLDELLANPSDMDFVIGTNSRNFCVPRLNVINEWIVCFTFESTEMISIELPEEYQRDSWQLSEDEKTKAIHVLREEGNALYAKGDRDAAELKYHSAIAIIEQLLMKWVKNWM